jgi:hypothetical protein
LKLFDPSSILLENDTILFRFDFYKFLSNFGCSYKQNLNYNEINSLFRFIQEKPFCVAECDKNVGLIILENSTYDFYCELLLSDVNNYENIISNPLNLINDNIKKVLDNLVLTKNISKKLAGKLLVSKGSLGIFKYLGMNCLWLKKS